MKQERLEMLIDVLQRVQDDDLPFDMGAWIERKSPCGTSACALGYAALDPRFQALGLRMVTRKGDILSIEQYNDMAMEAWTKFRQTIIMDVSYQGEDAYRAGSLLFDISLAASAALFDPETYGRLDTKPCHVIERVRAVIANNGLWRASAGDNYVGDDDDGQQAA
jgi:hypothetical protein